MSTCTFLFALPALGRVSPAPAISFVQSGACTHETHMAEKALVACDGAPSKIASARRQLVSDSSACESLLEQTVRIKTLLASSAIDGEGQNFSLFDLTNHNRSQDAHWPRVCTG
jgi:hypothetical protein